MLRNKKKWVKELFEEKIFKLCAKKSTFINLLTQNSYAVALFCTFICPGSGSVSLFSDPDPASLP